MSGAAAVVGDHNPGRPFDPPDASAEQRRQWALDQARSCLRLLAEHNLDLEIQFASEAVKFVREGRKEKEHLRRDAIERAFAAMAEMGSGRVEDIRGFGVMFFEFLLRG